MAASSKEKKVTTMSKNENLHVRNDGVPFQTDFFEKLNVNKSAVDRRASTLTKRRTVKKEF